MLPLYKSIIARAQACCGVRYRPQGRDPLIGLDCVGLVAYAYGHSLQSARYRLRGGDYHRYHDMINAAGLTPVVGGAWQAADLLLAESGPAQAHLLIWLGDAFIHADAQLRRVAKVPGPPPWPILGAWRASAVSPL